MSGQLKSSKTSYTFLKQELEDYKIKATKTLQSKDRLIASLKESAQLSDPSEVNSENPEKGSFNLKSIEIDELKAERDALKDELNSKSASVELLRSEIIVFI